MQQHSIYKRKAGVLFMDTRPLYFGKSFSRSPKQKRRGLRSHEMLSRNGKTAINDKKAETAPFGTASALYLLPVFENVSQR